MAVTDVEQYLRLVPIVQQTPRKQPSSFDDVEADVLYVSFGQPRPATASELTDDDVIIRYDGDEVIGLTILHASQR
jgi:hypothetical protein